MKVFYAPSARLSRESSARDDGPADNALQLAKRKRALLESNPPGIAAQESQIGQEEVLKCDWLGHGGPSPRGLSNPSNSDDQTA